MKHKIRGSSGKFQVVPLYGVKDILRHLKVEPNGCILTPTKLPFGRLRSGIWYIQIGKLTPAGQRKIMSVVEVLWNHYYPYSLIRHGTKNRQLLHTCKTAGCLNHKHYEMVNRKGDTFGSTYMAKQEIINLLTTALKQDETITFADAASAESFRMHIYRLKRKWKKENSPYHAMFEEVVIKKGKLHPNILDFTSQGRAFDDVLARFKATPAGTVEEPLGLEEKKYLDDVITGKDHGKEVLDDLGYTPSRGGELTSYDAVYAKAVVGGELTEAEERILEAGPEPERGT